ncbi:MAG TPA: F0F1 ATP synthase subunit delta [Stellaceae bacterium]|nr:F0F1 ATP synthase subunit delta [Stellaceae bacterium]
MASVATGVSGLAGRYATALFDLADQQKSVDSVAGELLAIRTMLAESTELRQLIANPVLSRAQAASAMAAILAKADIKGIVANFVALAARNRRLAVLPEIITVYQAILANRRGEMTATVTSAQKLSQQQIDTLENELRRSVGSKVKLDIFIDPQIIGGLIVRIGSRLIDGSLRTKLQKMQLAMKGI